MSGWVRPSIGTLAVLGLKRLRMSALPTTAYIMLGERCRSNCSFCAQRRDNPRNDRLSRVIWPAYDREELINALLVKKSFSRICLQTLDYPGMVEDSIELSERLRGMYDISVSMVPVSDGDMQRLRDAGVEYLSIALDGANPEIFRKVKGEGVGNRFTWEGHWSALRRSVRIFGKGNTHIIVGMGESDEDIVTAMERLRSIGVHTALFAYTPVNGGKYPDIGRYRAIQLAHALIYAEKHRDFHFKAGKLVDLGAGEGTLKEVSARAFMTSGCPGCNRPFYNERPGKELYNYPHPIERSITERALESALSYLHAR